MKKLLSLLLAVLLLNVQAHALSGGPVYGSLNQDVVGLYSGVLIPEDEPEITEDGEGNEAQASAIGLFSLSQPDAGLATGAVLIFVDGAPFSGSLNGIIDPDNGSLRAVISGTSQYNVVFLVPTTATVDGNTTTSFEREEFSVFATGNVDAQVVPTANIDTTGTGLNTSRIEGEASVDVFFLINDDGSPNVNRTVSFTVEGFKQSNTADTGTQDITLEITSQTIL